MLKDFAVAQMVPPVTATAGSVTTAAVDTRGYGTVIILVELGPDTTLGMDHCDLYTSNAGGGTDEILLGSAAPCGTGPDETIAFQVDTQECERYLYLTLSFIGSGTAVVSVSAILMDPKNSPIALPNIAKQVQFHA